MLIILSAITPILIAVDESDIISKWLPMITGALVAIGTAGLKTFNYQENFINYRTICEAMKREYHFLQARRVITVDRMMLRFYLSSGSKA